MYEPRQVPLGKKCGCICPACSFPLYAKHCESGKRAPHFAHAPGSACESGTETSLHLAAKQLIYDRKGFLFPELTATVEVSDAFSSLHRASQSLAAAAYRELGKVQLEQAVGSTRPDLLAEAADLGKVAIEIAVTHFTDEEKLKKLRSLALAAVEVDLSGIREATFDVLNSLLFENGSVTVWLFHPAVSAVEDELRQSLAPVLAESQARKVEEVARQLARHTAAMRERELEREQKRTRLRVEQIRNREERAEQTQKEEQQQRKTALFKNALEAEKREILRRWLGGADLPALLSVPTGCPGVFGVSDPHVWQTALFAGLIHKRAARGKYLLTLETAVSWMRERFESDDFHPESETLAVRDYLNTMVDEGALLARHESYYLIGIADLSAYETLRCLQAGEELPVYAMAECVCWVDEDKWPTANQPTVMAMAMSPQQTMTKSWYKLSTLEPSARAATPYRICEWGATLGIDEAMTFQYLVRTGYVRLKDY
ncbi:competence protein CoiA family protein [Massilia phyllosphaerae]|uniref:competence protein CoiA family protein n=1 Tax=Massilia phyllosphaerae TaxID=3106034 RepID=UPI002B1CC9B9|nr:competence protein CoiA family protein [Massilia sp. SGZ-792]